MPILQQNIKVLTTYRNFSQLSALPVINAAHHTVIRCVEYKRVLKYSDISANE